MTINTCQEHFKTHGYVKVPGAISPEVCTLLAKYVRFNASRSPKVRRGDDPLSGVHRVYGDPMMETLLEQYLPLIQQATGLSLHPTLAFSYNYVTGNLLKPHKDRESCEIVAGICIGADDKFKKNAQKWPLLLKDKEVVDLDYGDILVFRGHEIEHWREAFQGEWFVSAILGYVDQNGPFAYQKYDQRAKLGLKHVGMTRWLFGVLKNKLTA